MVFMLEVPHSRALVLFTESPVPQTCRFAPVPEEPCPPVIRKPLRLDALVVVRELALREVLLVIVGIFPAIVVLMSTPARYNGPASFMQLPMTAEPLTSMEGALTRQENTAVLASPSLSVPPESARCSV